MRPFADSRMQFILRSQFLSAELLPITGTLDYGSRCLILLAKRKRLLE
jgi:hypothetical protein